MEEIPIDFLKNIDGYKPSQYTDYQFERLSSAAKFSYMEKVIRYNSWCDAIGLPEKKVALKEI